MANKDNLIIPTSKQARENGKKGGIASAKAKRERKALRDTLENLLSMPLQDGNIKDIEDIKSLAELNDCNISVQDAIILKTIRLSLDGNIKALKLIFDLMALMGNDTGTTQTADPLSKAFEELENL